MVANNSNAEDFWGQNKNKWKTKMPADMIRKIETISYEMLNELNYDIVFANMNSLIADKWKVN